MAKDHPIKVLVVERLLVGRMSLVGLLGNDPQIQIVGITGNERDTINQVARKKPDIVLLDIETADMDGFEVTRKIMETQPVPIVICSSSESRETLTNFRLMEVGAVSIVTRPVHTDQPDFDQAVQQLCHTVKLMSEIKVVRRWPRGPRRTVEVPARRKPLQPSAQVKVVGIGASTGGPPVLQTILSGLPKDFPVPLLVVQHIAPGFLSGLAEWLNQTTGFTVQIAAYGITPLPGHVYMAPDDFHMGVNENGDIILQREPTENRMRPSVSWLFRSLADVYGSAAVGVLLTGMGTDGADELKHMKDAGATTIVQDKETSVVHGMPGQAIALDAATMVLPSNKIADALISRVQHRPANAEDRP